jgi:holo-[acyl-carrier protein] synthase
MGVLGIGVDVVYVPRIAALVKRRTAQRLASRILSAEEWTDYHTVKSDPLREASFLAVRSDTMYIFCNFPSILSR